MKTRLKILLVILLIECVISVPMIFGESIAPNRKKVSTLTKAATVVNSTQDTKIAIFPTRTTCKMAVMSSATRKSGYTKVPVRPSNEWFYVEVNKMKSMFFNLSTCDGFLMRQ